MSNPLDKLRPQGSPCQGAAMTELLPCPFCSAEAELSESHRSRWVECLDCGTQGPLHKTVVAATTAWNTRHTVTEGD